MKILKKIDRIIMEPHSNGILCYTINSVKALAIQSEGRLLNAPQVVKIKYMVWDNIYLKLEGCFGIFSKFLGGLNNVIWSAKTGPKPLTTYDLIILTCLSV